MPVAADIGLLVGGLADHGDLGMFVGQREIVVDVDPAPALGEGDVRFRCEIVLPAKQCHAVLVDCRADRIERIALGLAQSDACDLHPALRGQRHHLHCISLPTLPAYSTPHALGVQDPGRSRLAFG